MCVSEKYKLEWKNWKVILMLTRIMELYFTIPIALLPCPRNSVIQLEPSYAIHVIIMFFNL